MSMIGENIEFVDEDKIQDGGNDQESDHTRGTAGQQSNGSPGAATKQGARSRLKTNTSYLRPNRDYTKHITWSYKLQDIYNVYKEAEPGRRGYMKRMKDLWDQIHPKHKHLTSKHLREQTLRVIQKKLIKVTVLLPEQDME